MAPAMSRDSAAEEVPRSEREPRPDSVRGQMRLFTEQIAAAGKQAELFEIEMWLRSFERFFRIKNQPLSEKEQHQLASRNWSEELRLVDNAVVHVIALCTAILTEEQVNQAWFDKYIESYLRKDEVTDPHLARLLRQSSAEAGLTLLRESLEDVHVLLTELVKLSRIPYATFQAVGKLLYRETRRSHLLSVLIDKKFKPIHDRMTNPLIAHTIRQIPAPVVRRHAARVFLESFRILRYLEYVDPDRIGEDALKNTVLVFSLITSETRLLLGYIERKVLRTLDPSQRLYQLYDSLVYCVPLELKKVVNTELADISTARQSENVRARVENSHGILKDCFQQTVVQLAQLFDPKLEGHEVFADFTAKREQSVRLRDGLLRLIKAVRAFELRKDEAAAVQLKTAVSEFYDQNMKYLMYRDWAGFELFFIEILKCISLPALVPIGHRFETFLATLYREVNKRAILQDVPLAPDLAEVSVS